MSEHIEFDPDSGSFRPRESGGSWTGDGAPENPKLRSPGKTPPVSMGVNFWTAVDVIMRRWHWLAIGGILGCTAFFALSLWMVKPKFTATAQLLRYQTPGAGDSLQGNQLSTETFSGLIVSPEILRKVGDQADPPIPPDKLIKQIKVDPQPESDLVKVSLSASRPLEAVNLANAYAREVVAYTTAQQAKEAAEVANTYIKKQVAQMDKDIQDLHEQFQNLPMAEQVTNKLSEVSGNLDALNKTLAVTPRASPLTVQLSEKLQASMAELAELTSKYTELHPLVQQKEAQIKSLKKEILDASKNASDPMSAAGIVSTLGSRPGGQFANPNYEFIKNKLRALEDARIQMVNREHEAELFASNPPGNVRIFAEADLKTLQSGHRRIKMGLLTIFGGMLGMGGCLGLVLLAEVADSRLRTAEDLQRVTRLPVLTTLGDLKKMKNGSRAQWAFRTWTMLQGRLGRSQNHGIVCGITSSTEGEGRSTWIRLLAEAASLSGFRVLTIATRPSPTHVESKGEITNGKPANEMNASSETNQVAALTSNVLATPSQVTEQLTDPNSQPVVHIPLPGWVWNLDRRKEWRDALDQWRKIDNLVIFVELPPASVPEAVLLGANLPNLLWLAESDAADAGETKTQLKTLRDARCNLVGAVLNKEHSKPFKSRFPRWLTCLVVFAVLGLGGVARAQNTNAISENAPLEVEPAATEPQNTDALPPDANTNLSFSIVSPSQRAPWQKHLTLGPGDILNFELFGEPLLKRTEVPIAPDGRVSYLEAQDILATGLTVDELRQKMDDELGKFRRVAHVIITPVAYRSKKYFVLGKVVQKGVYVL
ncbi:MAG TPA: polysaccharide biosynthesis/export family protein, partial [Verrucomicrobiae bacterium]|nr:polysaccharide biosynthesis/export family protein [Verrucomicrobiae bacterium]